MLVPVLGFSVCVKDVFYQSFPIGTDAAILKIQGWDSVAVRTRVGIPRRCRLF